jgi:hypothetical protein
MSFSTRNCYITYICSHEVQTVTINSEFSVLVKMHQNSKMSWCDTKPESLYAHHSNSAARARDIWAGCAAGWAGLFWAGGNLHHSKYYAPYFITPQAASRSARERILRIWVEISPRRHKCIFSAKISKIPEFPQLAGTFFELSFASWEANDGRNWRPRCVLSDSA